MPNVFQIDTLRLGNQDITTTGTNLYINNVITSRPHISGSAPSTNSLSVPVSINVYGANNLLLGNPAGFAEIIVSGITYKIPFY